MSARIFVRVDPDDPGRGLLDADARAHLRARRLGPGDGFVAITGPGEERDATLERTGDALECRLGATRPRPAADPAGPVVLAVAIADPPRLDLVVEKATELGATRVALFRAERSQQADVAKRRLDRWRRIARAACEQCGRTAPPAIEVVGGIGELAAAVAAAGRALVFVAPGTEAPAAGAAAADLRPGDGGLVLVVGPEGGLTAGEIAALVRAGARVAGLGPRVLRFETAALAALARFAGDARGG